MSAQQGWAQYAKWKVGFSMQSEQTFYNSTISQFNPSTLVPSNEVKLPNAGWGWGFGLSTDFQVIDGLMVGGSFGLSRFSNGQNSYLSSYTDSEIKSFAIYGDFYPLKYIGNYFLPYVKESLFVRFSPILHKGTTSYNYYNIDNSSGVTTDTVGMQSNGDFTTFGVKLGVGYTKYVSDKLSLTGMMNMDYSFGSNSYSDVSTVNNLASESAKSNMFMSRFNVEVKLAYDIKQKLPLCPIKTCGIQQEHRHAVLGGASVRGNKYKHRQNQKYGDKHRGQVQSTKRKKTKTEREQKRIQRKEKRNRKRIRIYGAGH
ncbi:autotransporter outer membrane beta-barrel domain-containing protein [Flammeovirga pacifica]|uniref:Autotransporter domain-containing protein n=1 Tax=Flammeovirga pacifica TaxID=915059 RepID=A0A1S1Z492_FLAPC|nr:autotransporter outer membrane beta-barrel domain-containing protein [Flammeovirga pacifica]OHX68047.1 hypothetical protein NH26_17705 [Flammeovirga pacifica]